MVGGTIIYMTSNQNPAIDGDLLAKIKELSASISTEKGKELVQNITADLEAATADIDQLINEYK